MIGLQAVPRVFVLFQMTHPQFQPSSTVASMLTTNLNKTITKADELDEVGVLSIKYSSGENPAFSWSFIFPLEGFGKPTYRTQIQKAVANQLFGRVLHRQMMEPMTKLSTVPIAERKNVKVTLESI